jgi:hypothetical protein
VQFPGAEVDESMDEEPGLADEPVRPRRRRARQAARADSLPRYLVTGGAVLLAVLAIWFLMLQLGQIGQRATPAVSGATAVSAAVQPAPAVPPGSPAEQAAPQPVVPQGQGPLRVTSRVLDPTYAVAAGDTLGNIAAKFGTTVDALQSINNLPDRNALSIGQKLVIPNQQ